MSTIDKVPTAESDPVDAVKDILGGYNQLQELRVLDGETVTIPEGEVWFVLGEIDIEGELITNGELVNGVLWGSEAVELYVRQNETRTVEADEILAVDDITVEGELIVGGEVVNQEEALDNPNVAFNESVAQKAKENEQEPSIYLSHNGEDTFERFSADKDELREDETVAASIWVVGDSERTARKRARQYKNALVRIFKSYMNDNFEATKFHNIEPSNASDFRMEYITRQTGHYIYTVEIDTERLK